jgi:hypothetical protein
LSHHRIAVAEIQSTPSEIAGTGTALDAES